MLAMRSPQAAGGEGRDVSGERHIRILNEESHWVTVEMSSKQLQFIRWLADYHIRTGSNEVSLAQSRALSARLSDYVRPPIPRDLQL